MAMRKTYPGTVAASLMAMSVMATGALAQTVMAQAVTPTPVVMNVTGFVPQACTLQPGKIQAGGLVNLRGLDGDTLQIEELTDQKTLATRATSATIDFAATCSLPHRVRIETQNNGLWPTTGAMGSTSVGFAYALPYNATVSWAGVSGLLQADAKVRRLNQQLFTINGPASGNIELRIQMDAGASNVQANAPVLAGAYGDTLRIYLEPQ